jgi:hypothetical protein
MTGENTIGLIFKKLNNDIVKFGSSKREELKELIFNIENTKLITHI